MELIQAYMYNVTPIRMSGIHPDTFDVMTSEARGWLLDRFTAKVKVFSKRFQVKDKWYRVMVRFKATDDHTFELESPVPFAIIETTFAEGGIFRDKTAHHGRQVGSTVGYLQRGIPIELIDAVIHDLTACIDYADSRSTRRVRNPFSLDDEDFIDFDVYSLDETI
ncbi:hypothetical protein [Alicyclobacillus shizuokensis]|uniref:hypothetical protein n=1 Tax=Alicyclobacillus shizuokensis TaxID=392014 RepID=UPI0008353588|nr:hypothetical protein [Alicyclobacillus shizuokensis]